MATPILKVITQYCDVYVDDIRLQQTAAEDKPLYARQMWGYFQAAIPFFTIPNGMFEYLCGTYENPKLTPPQYGNLLYTVENNLTTDLTVELNESGVGYELFCCRQQVYDDFGNVILLPDNGVVTYNSENGTIAIHATAANPVAKGTIYNIDFYTDGQFEENLSPEIMRILGMCFQVVWQMRFDNDWLSNVSKVEDKSFFEQNRANKIKADDARLAKYNSDLASAMRRYEQKLACKKMFPRGTGLI